MCTTGSHRPPIYHFAGHSSLALHITLPFCVSTMLSLSYNALRNAQSTCQTSESVNKVNPICRPTRRAIALGDTTLSAYDSFSPMQPGCPIYLRIAHSKCYKNEPFLPGSFCAMDTYLQVIATCFSHTGAQINGNFEANKDRAARACEL